jgi:hypothetical protein
MTSRGRRAIDQDVEAIGFNPSQLMHLSRQLCKQRATVCNTTLLTINTNILHAVHLTQK